MSATRSRLRSLLTAICFVCLGLGARAETAKPAEPYKAGDALAAFTTKDQHGKEYTFAPGVKTVVIAFTMGVGKDTNRFLEKQPADFLETHGAIFIANIHGMPGIGRTFAMPKMRKYPHRILLADEEHFLDRYPKEDGKVTVLRLGAAGTITAIEFVDPEKNAAAAFGEAK